MTLWMNHIASKKTSTVSDPLFNRYIFPVAAALVVWTASFTGREER
jgi:hypothetical protein